MNGCRVLLVLLAAVLGGGLAAAQQAGSGAAGTRVDAARGAPPRDIEASAAIGEGSAPSDAELRTFVEIYAELQKTAQAFEREVGTAETAQDVRAIRLKRRRDDDTTLRRHGWTRDEFMRVAEALNSNPALAEKAVRLVGRDS